MAMRVVGVLLALAACGSEDSGPRPTVFGGDRPAQLHTPATLTDGKLYPLVVLLHGYSATGLLQSAYFQIQTLVETDAAFYIAPDGNTDSYGKQFWNADPACCDLDGTNPDDVGYIGGLIDDILDTWPVDPGRVYVLGHSNGGYMAYRMACERADVISAIGSLAGNASTTASSCTPSKPVSVLHMHGTADMVVPYDGGPAFGGVGAVSSVEQWAAHDGCGTTRTATVTLDLDTNVAGSETHGEATDGCPGSVGVELWTMEGSTHIPLVPMTFSTTVLDWFQAHHR